MSDIYSADYRSAPSVEAPPILSPGLRRMAGAALFLLLVVGMAVWAYRLGTRDAAEIPIIRAMEEPPRIQPADPGGLQAEHQGLEVNSVLGGAPAPVPTIESLPPVAPPPPVLAEEDGPQGELVVALPEIPAIDLPAEGEDLRMPVQEDGPVVIGDAPAAEPLSRPAELGTDVASLIRSLETGAADDDAGEVAGGPRPRVRPSGLVVRASSPAPSAAPAPQAQASAQSAPPAAQAQAAPASGPREVASVAPGTRLVQLGAFDSEGLARQTWNGLVARHGDLLGAKTLFLERATNNARVFYRLRVAGFQNTDQTRILCEQLRARGVDCIPVTLN